MNRYRQTFQFAETEAEAKAFCDAENRAGSAYKRKKYPASYTPWTSSDGKEQKFVCWYYA